MSFENFDTKNYLQELASLVNIDSVSSEPDGAAKIANFMKNKYESIGWHVKVNKLGSSIGPCLEITNSTSQKYDVLLLAHMDTVFPVGTALKRPFKVNGGRAYGPGVIDCKGGMLAGYYVLKELMQNNALKDANICVSLNSDHEGIGSKYSRSQTERLAKASRCVLVLEAGRANGNLLNKRKGIARYKIAVKGIAAHAGINPADGRNAIEELSYCVIKLQKETDYTRNKTLNIGKISGGTAVNAVPDYAEAALDVRYFDENDVKDVEKVLGMLKNNPYVPDTHISVTGGVSRPPMIPDATTIKLCDNISKIGAKLNVKFDWATSGGGSDGSFCARLGTPTLDALGPVGGGAHTNKEYMELDSIVPRCRLLYESIKYIISHDL